ncbi:MAG: hypothetical protein ACE5MK_00285 [Acidobacteriota bacterium]
MGGEGKSLHELTREFLAYYPDYAFCRTLAFNIKNNVTTYQNAVEILAKRAWAAKQNRGHIEETLDRRSVIMNGKLVRIKDLSLKEIMNQEEGKVLKEILDFYFKHPYAHGRTKKSRLLPRWIRTFFLSTLIGHAKRRGVDLDYDAYFEMLTLL